MGTLALIPYRGALPALVVAVALALPAGLAGQEKSAAARTPDVHFVPTDTTKVREMLAAANVTARDTVYDLGCGDGRFVITWKTFGNGDNSQSGISAQYFNSEGARLGGEFLVNTTKDFAQNTPAGDAFASGRSIITWIDFSGVGDAAPLTKMPRLQFASVLPMI